MRGQASLHRKLIVLVVTSIVVATAISSAIGLWQQAQSYVQSRKQGLVATAEVFAATAGQAAAALDRDGAFASLRGMARIPDVHYAEVRDRSGNTLASFGAISRLIDDVAISRDVDASLMRVLRSGTIEVVVPIIDGGVRVGEFVLIGGIADLPGQLLSTITFTSLGGTLGLAVGLMVAWRFQRRITGPLKALLRAMTRVREEGNYDVTARSAPDREIGELVAGFNHMLGDIRERDRRLEAHARNLEGEVSARTAELRSARDAAEAASTAKSDFLATMSHEIRTPMNGIMVMADLLSQAELPRRERRFADVIATSGKNMLAIINDILDFSKIEAGKLELERVSVDLNGIVENVTSLFAERAREKNLDLAAFVHPLAPRTILSDPVRLAQIVSNLVNNALKFTERGYVRIDVRTSASNTELEIAISDSGIGIPQDKVDSIFESFSQADQSTTRNFGGTGLGLTISQRLARALDGKIVVESVPGRGSTFSVRLPFQAIASASSWPRFQEKVLRCVLDIDGDATRPALEAYLCEAGFVVAMPSEGINTEPFEADVICVEIDRVDLYQVNRRESEVILIGFSSPGDKRAEEFLAAGKLDACLTKPILRSEIEETLRRICSGERLALPVSSQSTTSLPQPFERFAALIADDNAVNREVAFAALTQLNAVVTSVENGLEALEAVSAGHFDIVFMDGSMPVMDGFEATRRIRLGEQARRVPIVALTAHVVGTSADEWRDAGMDAVVHKPFTVAALAQTIERLLPNLGRAQLQSNDPQDDTASDPGSIVLDAGILAQLRELQASRQTGFLKKVLQLYFDHAPPAVSDIRDAAAGQNAEQCARAAHALKSMSYNVGATLMSSLASEIESKAKMHSQVADPALLGRLELALEQTLTAIGLQPEFMEEDGSSTLPVKQDTLSDALEHAIEREEFSLAYQPIVDQARKAMVGVEALLRWTHEGRSISPAEFVPIAESNGLIHKIGEWTLRKACSDAKAWPGIELSVNVSAVQFRSRDLAERIERIVSETGFAWKRLQLEITETALLNSEDEALAIIEKLRAKGASIALDDFGTGYSSLTYLRRFPFDKLKIDRTFVSEVSLTVNATIVHAIITIGRSLGIKLVAEGVETPQQQKFLSAAGVHFFQGYLFGQPQSADMITEQVSGSRLTASARPN